MSLDAGVIYKGYHSDAARTHAVGEIRPDLQKLIDVTRESFFEGIKFAKEGNHLYDISRAIGDYAESFGTVLSGNCADMESGPVFMNHRRFRISRCEEEDRS